MTPLPNHSNLELDCLSPGGRYMFDTGFPPAVLAQLAGRVNALLQLGTLAHFACFHNPKT